VASNVPFSIIEHFGPGIQYCARGRSLMEIAAEVSCNFITLVLCFAQSRCLSELLLGFKSSRDRQCRAGNVEETMRRKSVKELQCRMLTGIV
jgi:hypothetical protein